MAHPSTPRPSRARCAAARARRATAVLLLTLALTLITVGNAHAAERGDAIVEWLQSWVNTPFLIIGIIVAAGAVIKKQVVAGIIVLGFTMVFYALLDDPKKLENDGPNLGLGTQVTQMTQVRG